MVPRRTISGDPGPSYLDPDALCDECGTLGTIGTAVRHTVPPTVVHFCRTCWPQAHQRLRAEWGDPMQHRLDRLTRGEPLEDEPPPGYTFQSRAWTDAAEFVGSIERALARADHGLSAGDLAGIVAQIRALAPLMDGPMPPGVRDFLQRHGPPAG